MLIYQHYDVIFRGRVVKHVGLVVQRSGFRFPAVLRKLYFQLWRLHVALVAQIPHKAVGPMYIGRVSPEHVKDPMVPVEKSKVLLPTVTGQILELLRIAVKLHRHHYC